MQPRGRPLTRKSMLPPYRPYIGSSTEEMDQQRYRRLDKLAISLARTASVHAAATHLAEVAQWDMLAVRYTVLADVKRDIASGTANAENLSGAYEGTVATVYRLLDMM